ncbi:MAG: hypothetical protein WA441_07000, partial [Methyloceanibacter sp.]
MAGNESLAANLYAQEGRGEARSNFLIQTPFNGDDILTLRLETQAQAAPRPSQSEINATIKALGIHALGREDYCVLLDGGVATRRADLARKLTLR